MFDARNDTSWTTGVVACRPLTNGGVLRPGARVERVTKFLGRQFTYEYRVTAREDDRRVDLSVDEPFPMRIRYELADDEGGTLASIRATGDAGRFFRIGGPLLAFMVRRNIARDLAALKAHLENSAE
jgi:Polyketide cyclase / dehydrase and lipid transport